MCVKTTMAFWRPWHLHAGGRHRYRDSGHAWAALGRRRQCAACRATEPGKTAVRGRHLPGIVMPPYRGDSGLAVEGDPEMAYDITAPDRLLDLEYSGNRRSRTGFSPAWNRRIGSRCG